MTTQSEAIFEAPAAHEGAHEVHEGAHEVHEIHEAAHYSNPYAGEMEDEATEFEDEWEAPEAAHYSNPYATEFEDEADPFLGNILGAVTGALGLEAEDYAGLEAEDEWEDEADAFFKKAFRSISRIAKSVAPLAKSIMPIATKALGSMLPGVGAIAGPLLGQLMGGLAQEGEAEAAQMEAELFGTNEMEAEVGETEAAHEAALTELLAAEAAEAESESEAASIISTALPITITIMGGRRALRPVVPVLAQANNRLTRVLRRQGPAGRQLLRVVPAIQRRAVATMRAAARAGKPITAPLAIRAMAAATRNVLGNPRQVRRAITRNAVLRQRVAPPTPRRAAVFAPRAARTIRRPVVRRRVIA